MNIQVNAAKTVERPSKLAIVDCDVHPLMPTPGHIRKYLSKHWADYFDEYGSLYRRPFVGGDPYPRAAPYLCRRDSFPPTGGPPGSDLPFMCEQLLDLHNVEYGILQVLGGGAHERNVEFGIATSIAVNNWVRDEWTSQDSRLKGTISLMQDDPESAVAEINRLAPDKSFAQVAIGQRTMEPAGRRRYWPIYQAAVEHNISIGIHTGGFNGHPPVPGGGYPSFYAEQHHLISVAMQSVVTSLVMEGVFEKFPTLRVVLVEGGFTWLPSLLWRLDSLWKRYRSENPMVKRPPSEYVREHCWFSTQPMDEMGGPEDLRKVFDWVGWDRICFASDYPHWDFDDPRYAISFRMSDQEKAMIYNQNAKRAYNLP